MNNAITVREMQEQFQELIDTKMPIRAIKMLREIFPGMGLKAAKDAVESINEMQEIPCPLCNKGTVKRYLLKEYHQAVKNGVIAVGCNPNHPPA